MEQQDCDSVTVVGQIISVIPVVIPGTRTMPAWTTKATVHRTMTTLAGTNRDPLRWRKTYRSSNTIPFIHYSEAVVTRQNPVTCCLVPNSMVNGVGEGFKVVVEEYVASNRNGLGVHLVREDVQA